MPGFKDDQIIVIAPGSLTTLAQLGLPESFTPAKVRIRSRMFPAEKPGQYEPYKIRIKGRRSVAGAESGALVGGEAIGNGEENVILEEDYVSEEGAIWPITGGRITDWPCFYALMNYVYNTLNPPFHTPIILISQPAWTPRDHEKLAQFFFEKFKIPAFALVDSAIASCYAFGCHTATVVDVGLDKSDITAVSDFLIHDRGRGIAIPNTGGEAMTQRLVQLLGSRGFKREMCEQLKRSPICEILPPDTPLPGTTENKEEIITNPAAAASTGATGSGPGQRNTAGAMGTAPIGPGPDTQVGEEYKDDDDNEGVLDVASIVTGGKMNEYLARKEKEKADKAASRKKGSDATVQPAKPVRLPNSKRERNSFLYEDHALLDALKEKNLSGDEMAEAQARLDEGTHKDVQTAVADGVNGADAEGYSRPANRGTIRREIEVGLERFQPASGGIVESIADAIHRAILSVEEVNKRSELWDSLVICGNGSKALMATLTNKYLIPPSSATIFTSEIPSNISTPTGTGANTPQPQMQPSHGSHVNPLLLAATTAQVPHLNPSSSSLAPHHGHSTHSSHGQTPSSIRTVKIPEYFPEWKDFGYDEAAFLGAQVAAKVLFVVDQGTNKGYMNRTDYNDNGPTGIHDYTL
ncbi:MAG: Actin-like protein arp9 (SWI/SNF complex component arp9) [Bathelium mastoideum]|nr:MAG: Actin-like protein arp9 (SWI/SNF complex component arp9) [Bathelium mastoideum]